MCEAVTARHKPCQNRAIVSENLVRTAGIRERRSALLCAFHLRKLETVGQIRVGLKEEQDTTFTPSWMARN